MTNPTPGHRGQGSALDDMVMEHFWRQNNVARAAYMARTHEIVLVHPNDRPTVFLKRNNKKYQII